MNIGNYEVHLINAGRYKLDGGAMFGVVPKTLWNKTNPADEKNRILLALNTLLLIGNGRIILVDTGVGQKFPEKFAEIYAVDYSEHSLLASLAARNIQPEDITDVIITHLHFDHAGGATFYNENGKSELQFENATHHVQEKQLIWAQKQFPKDRASYLEENIEPIRKSENLHLINGELKLFEGVEILISDGHTFAHQMVKIHDHDKTLLYAGDLIPMTSHIPVPWVMAYDLSPMITIKEKEIILKKVVDENWLIFFEHDPLIYCGTAEVGNRGYQLKAAVEF